MEPERSLAYAVVVQLQARFRGCLLSIEPIFGKHDAMPGTATFQEEIMLASKTDIVLWILGENGTAVAKAIPASGRDSSD